MTGKMNWDYRACKQAEGDLGMESSLLAEDGEGSWMEGPLHKALRGKGGKSLDRLWVQDRYCGQSGGKGLEARKAGVYWPAPQS